MGHEYCGYVEEVGRDDRHLKPGPFVVGSFATSDNTCPHCAHPGKVFDLTLPLEKVAEGCRPMDERRAIKALLQP